MIMKCPYCQKEMEKGFIYSGKTNICWTPLAQQRSSIINRPLEHEVQLAKYNFLKGCQVFVYRCSDCLIEMIDEKEVHENQYKK